MSEGSGGIMRGWVGRDWPCSEAAAVFGRGGVVGGTGCKEISGGVRKAEPSEAVLGVGGHSMWSPSQILSHFTPPVFC